MGSMGQIRSIEPIGLFAHITFHYSLLTSHSICGCAFARSDKFRYLCRAMAMEKDYSHLVEQTWQELRDSLAHRFTTQDMEMVGRAFELARQAHSLQRRKSGEPYILHPLAVARITGTDLELDSHMVAAALLHDVVEDTPYTLTDIRERFGDDVASLVNVVTKRPKQNYAQSKQVDNFRQILESVHSDVRALLIKLADRLHNMRTLEAQRPDKQLKIAGETDYFYAPLANRLGLYHIKSELENLSFRFRQPRYYERINRKMNEYMHTERPHIEAFAEAIDHALTERGINAHTEVRYRVPSSIARKMHDHDCTFAHVEGKHYLRVVFPETPDHAADKEAAIRIYSALTDVWREKPGSTTNYIDTPKENGYQSFHLKLLTDGRWEEIHIASELMLRQNRVTRSGEINDPSIHNWLEKFRRVLDDAAADPLRLDFLDSATTLFYNDDIRVFTPDGHEVLLPKNATALDFAYEISEHIGRHATHVRVNGKLCSVKTVLRRGDVVEVGTDPLAVPGADWLMYAHTFKAQKALRDYAATLPSLPYRRCEHCHPIPGEEVIGFRNADDSVTIHRRSCPEAIRAASRHGDRITEVDFPENPQRLYQATLRIRGVDRYHLLSDIIDCITEQQGLNMHHVTSDDIDNIAHITITFDVTGLTDLERTIASIESIPGVDEVLQQQS